MNETQKVRKQIISIALPVSIGFLFNTLFNVVDTYWAGKISSEALASLSITFPVFFIILAFGNGLSIATTALMSNAYGEKDDKKALSYYFHSIFIGAIIGFFISFFAENIAKTIFSLSKIPAELQSIALLYIMPILSFSIFFIYPFLLNSILNAQGNTKPLRNSLVFGFFINCILNPWFMYGGFGLPSMGIVGIAYATIVVQILSSIYIFYEINKRNLFNNFFKIKSYFSIQKLSEIIIQSIPSVLNFSLIIVGSIVLFYFISSFDSSVFSGYSIALRLEQIALLPAIGLNIAVLSLIGKYNGAKDHKSMRLVINESLKIGLYIMSFGTVCILIFGGYISGLFSTDQKVIDEAVKYLTPAAIGLFAYAVIFITNSFFQGIKKPNITLIVSVVRQIVLPFIIFYILEKYTELNVYMIWYTILFITVFSAIISYIYMMRFIKMRE